MPFSAEQPDLGFRRFVGDKYPVEYMIRPGGEPLEAAAVGPERRRDLLSPAIQRETANGGRIESRWVIVALTGGEKRSVITVDEFGRVNVTGREGGRFSPLMIVAVVIAIVFLIAIVNRYTLD